ARAARHYRKACEGHAHLRACNNLGVLEDKGAGVPVDHAAARIHYARACDGDLGDACFNLGMALADPGDHVEPDAVHARAAFDRGCAHDHVDSCVNAGILWFRGQGGAADPVIGRARLARACELGDGHACETVKELTTTETETK
ncbi:MAG: sel1 repeat family protein, partial [Myxococcales bacterium]|nr:sel1 repeat family protein [Myxococcales bacterium]